MATKKNVIQVTLDAQQVIEALKRIEGQLASLTKKFQQPIGTSLGKLPKDFDTAVQKLDQTVKKVAVSVNTSMQAMQGTLGAVEARLQSLTTKAVTSINTVKAAQKGQASPDRQLTYMDRIRNFHDMVNSKLAQANKLEEQLGRQLLTRSQIMERFAPPSHKGATDPYAMPQFQRGAFRQYLDGMREEIRVKKQLEAANIRQANAAEVIERAYKDYSAQLMKTHGAEISKEQFIERLTTKHKKFRNEIVLNKQAFLDEMRSMNASLQTMDRYAGHLDRIERSMMRMNRLRQRVGLGALTESQFAEGFVYTSKQTGDPKVLGGRWATEMERLRDIAKQQGVYERYIANQKAAQVRASKDLLSSTAANLTRLIQWVLIYRVIHELVLGIQRVIRETVQLGVQYYKAMEIQKIGLRGILAENFKIYSLQKGQLTEMQSMKLVTGEAERQWRQLQSASLAVVGTTEDMMQLYEGILPFAAHLGKDLEDIQEMTQAAAIAAGSLGISFQDTRSALIAMLQGRALVRNKLVGALGITREEIRELKGTPELFDHIMDKLSAFAGLAEDSTQSFAALSESMKDFVGLIGSGVVTPYINQFKEFVNWMSSAFMDRQGGLLGPSNELKSFFRFMQTTAVSTLQNFKTSLSNWTRENRANFRTFAAGVQDAIMTFAGFLVSIGKVVTALTIFAARNRDLIKAFVWISAIIVAGQKLWNLRAVFMALESSATLFATALRKASIIQVAADTKGAAAAAARATAEELKVAAYLGVPGAAGRAAAAEATLTTATTQGAVATKAATVAANMWRATVAGALIGTLLYVAAAWYKAAAAARTYKQAQAALNKKDYDTFAQLVEEGFSSGKLGRRDAPGTMLGSAHLMTQAYRAAETDIMAFDIQAERKKTREYEAQIIELGAEKEALDKKFAAMKLEWRKRRAAAIKAGTIADFKELEPTLSQQEEDRLTFIGAETTRLDLEREAVQNKIDEYSAVVNNLQGYEAARDKLYEEVDKILDRGLTNEQKLAHKAGKLKRADAISLVLGQELGASASGPSGGVAAGLAAGDRQALQQYEADLKEIEATLAHLPKVRQRVGELNKAREVPLRFEAKLLETDELDDLGKGGFGLNVIDNYWKLAFTREERAADRFRKLRIKHLRSMGGSELDIDETEMEVAKREYANLLHIADKWKESIKEEYYGKGGKLELQVKKMATAGKGGKPLSSEEQRRVVAEVTQQYQNIINEIDDKIETAEQRSDEASARVAQRRAQRDKDLTDLGEQTAAQVDSFIASAFGTKEEKLQSRIEKFVDTLVRKFREIVGRKFSIDIGFMGGGFPLPFFDLSGITWDELFKLPDLTALTEAMPFAEIQTAATENLKRIDASIQSVRESQKLLNDQFQAGDLSVADYVVSMRELQRVEEELLKNRLQQQRAKLSNAEQANVRAGNDPKLAGLVTPTEQLESYRLEISATEAELRRLISTQTRLNATFNQFTSALEATSKFAGMFGKLGSDIGTFISKFTAGFAAALENTKKLKDEWKGFIAQWQLWRQQKSTGGGAGATGSGAVGAATAGAGAISMWGGLGAAAGAAGGLAAAPKLTTGWGGLEGFVSGKGGGGAAAAGGGMGKAILGSLPIIGMAASAAIGIASALFAKAVEKAKDRISTGMKKITDAVADGSRTLGQGIEDMEKYRASIVKQYSKSKSGRKALKEMLPELDNQIDQMKERVKGIREAFEDELKKLRVGGGPFGDFANALFDLEKKTREYLGTFSETSKEYLEALENVNEMFRTTMVNMRQQMREQIIGFESEAISSIEQVFSLMEEQQGIYENLEDLARQREEMAKEAEDNREEYEQALEDLAERRNELAERQLEIQQKITEVMRKAREDEEAILRRGMLEAQLTIAEQKAYEISKVRMDAKKELEDLRKERDDIQKEIDGFGKEVDDFNDEWRRKNEELADKYEDLNTSEARLNKQLRLNQIRLDGARRIAEIEAQVFGLAGNEYDLARRRTELEYQQAQIQVQKWHETMKLVEAINRFEANNWKEFAVPEGFPVIRVTIGNIHIDNSMFQQQNNTPPNVRPQPVRPDKPWLNPGEDGRFGYPLPI